MDLSEGVVRFKKNDSMSKMAYPIQAPRPSCMAVTTAMVEDADVRVISPADSRMRLAYD